MFKDPDTGFDYAGSSRADLVRRILAYRIQNKLPQIEALDKVLDNYLCALPENKGKCYRYKLERGLLPAIKGGIALLENLWFKKTVSQKEADRRSKICAGCKYNIFPDKGKFVEWSDEIAVHSVGEKKSAYHDKLGNCAVCTCPLRAKVWFGGKLTNPADQEEMMRKVKCWQTEAKTGL